LINHTQEFHFPPSSEKKGVYVQIAYLPPYLVETI